MSPYINSL